MYIFSQISYQECLITYKHSQYPTQVKIGHS